jgi:hypothetical protein
MNIADNLRIGDRDKAESLARSIDEKTTNTTGISIFHILTAASIIGSIALFMNGKKLEAIFVGLWPPTFQALKSATENNNLFR